ncbi:YoaK family protein [Sphingomonas sp.]|uniref:YoaK family protein n=1 Tax=Sphingomonas sp. TaxID=28214 RepID=UPI0025FC4F79|nr:YoaK family protein [Sphingomonas sp.]
MAIGLSMLAGFVDALGFLSLGGLFVSFMSGNSTRFAVGVTQSVSVQVALLPLAIIALFVFGVMIGKGIRHYARRRASSSVLTFMALLLGMAALCHAFRIDALAIPLMAVAMGAANNVFVREGEVAIGVTYMTGTLVKFAQRLAGRLLGEPGGGWLPYFLLWLGLVGGAVTGAIAFAHIGLASLWIAAAWAACLMATGRRSGL